MAPTLDGLSLTGVVGIDMPLGLLADGWRAADALARRALGRRGVTQYLARGAIHSARDVDGANRTGAP